MKRIVLSLGSNIQPQANIDKAVREIRSIYGEIEVSPVYETTAVGFRGDPFFNLVLGFRSDDPLPTVIERLHRLETAAGRARGPKKFASRVLDLDVILYGNENWQTRGINVPRDEIERYAYVLKPLVDLYPDMVHPVLGRTFRAMWADFSSVDPPQFLAKYSLHNWERPDPGLI